MTIDIYKGSEYRADHHRNHRNNGVGLSDHSVYTYIYGTKSDSGHDRLIKPFGYALLKKKS